MDWTDAIEDRWGGRHGTIGLGLRLLGVGLLAYVLIRQGAFSGALWVAIGTAATLLICLAMLLLRLARPFDRRALALVTLLMVLGIALNPAIHYLGSVFFVVGGIMLVGQPEVPLRIGVGITAVLTVGLVARAVIANPEWTVLLSNLFGGVVVVLLGANRRQRVLRLRETARASQLEERSRIASDLHDVLAHSLGGLIVQLDAAEAELESGRTAEAAARIGTSRQLAVEGLREARIAVEQLRSGSTRAGTLRLGDAPVDPVDVVRTIVQGPVGLQLGVGFDLVGEPRQVSPAVAEALAGTAREALTNVNKHAPGSPVSVTLMFESATVRLEVVNGLGSGRRVADLAQTGGGAGLTGLRERVESVGGTFDAGPEGRRWVVAAECPAPAGQRLAGNSGAGHSATAGGAPR